MTTESKVGHRKTVCVDLDNTLADYSQGWQGVDVIGDPIPGAQDFVRKLRDRWDVVIFTTRCNPEINRPEAVHLLRNRVAAWLERHGFEYDDIYTGHGKPIAAAYIDDRAVECVPAQFENPEDGYREALEEVEDVVLGQPTVLIEFRWPGNDDLQRWAGFDHHHKAADHVRREFWESLWARDYPERTIVSITPGRDQWDQAPKQTAIPEVGIPPAGEPIAIRSCARCGKDHDRVWFYRLRRPAGPWTHWGTCPTHREPIWMKMEWQDDDDGGHDVPEAESPAVDLGASIDVTGKGAPRGPQPRGLLGEIRDMIEADEAEGGQDD